MAEQSVLLEHSLVFLIASTAALISHRVASYFGFWKEEGLYEKRPRGTYFIFLFLLGFLIFLGLQLVLIAIATLFQISRNSTPWFNALTIFISSTGVWLFSISLPHSVKHHLWGNRPLRNFLIGMLCWTLAYPAVLAVGQLVGMLTWLVEPFPTPEQVAVRQVRQAQSNPLLLAVYLPLIAFIVPLAEEILFRGLLQSWLRSFLSFRPAVVVTSLIFALCHFADSQAAANWELLVSLFVLSLYLGYLYERQKSLWASIGLHALFNAISLFFIIFVE